MNRFFHWVKIGFIIPFEIGQKFKFYIGKYVTTYKMIHAIQNMFY
jgi:hypothetical protein